MGSPIPESRLGELVHVSLAVLSTDDPRQALTELVRALVHEMALRAAVVRLLDEEDQTLHSVAACGLSEAYLTKGPIVPTPGSLDARVLAGETVELRDVTTDPAFQYPAQARQEGLRAVLAVPVSVHGQPLGVLRAYRGATTSFTAADRRTLEATALLAGEAFDKARRTTALEALERDLASTLQLSEVVEHLVDHAIIGLRFAAAAVRLLDEEGGLELAGARGLDRRYLRAGERRGDSALDSRVLGGELVVIPDLSLDPKLQYADAALAAGIRAVVSAPLISRGRPLGLLRGYSRRVRTFDANDLRFVRLVADLGALAIDNARLHQALQERVAQLGSEVDGWYRFLIFG